MALESYLYGNPERVAEIRQSQRANEQKRAEAKPRRTLTVRKGWAARKAIESLFAGGAAVSGDPSPALPAMGSLPGELTGKNLT